MTETIMLEFEGEGLQREDCRGFIDIKCKEHLYQTIKSKKCREFGHVAQNRKR